MPKEWASAHETAMDLTSKQTDLTGPPIPPGSDTPERTRRQALDLYRRMTLAFCGNLDLVDLSCADRRLAARQFYLRQLYVPLHVRVEQVLEEPEGAADDAAPVRLNPELRRRLERARSAGRRPACDNLAAEEGPGESTAFIGERLAVSRRLVVLGDPGSGKTTLLKWIALAYLLRLHEDPEARRLGDVSFLPARDWLPILVRCRDLDPATLAGSLGQLLHRTLHLSAMPAEHAEVLPGLLAELLAADQAILLIDGLDEIADPDLRRRFGKGLRRILDALPGAPVVVTSRIVGYREMGLGILRDFEHVVVAELSREDKELFVRRWCALTEPPERCGPVAEALLRAIHGSDRVEHLTGNPMLLTTLAVVQRRFSGLPHHRAALYKNVVDVLLRWRSEVDEPLDHAEALPQVQYLAYAMCHRHVQQLRATEALHLLRQMRQEYPSLRKVQRRSPEDFLKLLVTRTGMLGEVGEVRHQGRREPVYEFRHLAFQEYLAGLALVQGCYPGRKRERPLAVQVRRLASRLASRTGEAAGGPAVSEDWREALRLCVASCPHGEADRVLAALVRPLPGEEEGVRRARAVLAASCLADEPDVRDTTAQQVLERFVAYLNEFDGRHRSPVTGADHAVWELARSEFWSLLGPLLLEAFRRRSPHARQRPGVLYGLGAWSRAPQTEEGLGGWLDGEIQALAFPEPARAIGACLAIMEAGYQGKPNYRPGVVESLLPLLGRDGPTAHAAAWAMSSLRLSRPEAQALVREDGCLERLLAVLEDPDADKRAALHVARLLGRVQVAEAVGALLERLGDDDRRVIQAAGGALVNIGKPAVERVLHQAREPRGDVRRRLGAIAVCEFLDDPRIDDTLRKLLTAPDRRVRTQTLGVCLRKAGVSETDLKLLSEQLDGRAPFRDPDKPISLKDVGHASTVLQLDSEVVQERLQRLADQFFLKLW